MAFGKNKTNLIQSVSELKEADYSKNPELGSIYERLIEGKKKFGEVLENDMNAVMQISSLDLTLLHNTDKMMAVSERIDEATSIIYEAANDTSEVAERVAGQHQELTSTIIKASGDTETVYELHSSKQLFDNFVNDVDNSIFVKFLQY